MSKEIIGHIDCPICGHEMPIKADKNGHAYGHCQHRCNGQVFSRTDDRDALLRARMRPVTVTGTGAEPTPAPAAPITVPEPVPAPAPTATTTAPPKKPTPAPRASFFQPLMGRAKP